MKRLAGPPSKAQMCVTSLRLGVASAAKSALAETVVATYTSTAPQRCAAPRCPHAPAMFVLTALVVLLVALTATHVGRAPGRAAFAARLCRRRDGRARRDASQLMPFERVVIDPRLPTSSFSTARSKTAARLRRWSEKGATVVLVLGPGCQRRRTLRPARAAAVDARRPDRSSQRSGVGGSDRSAASPRSSGTARPRCASGSSVGGRGPDPAGLRIRDRRDSSSATAAGQGRRLRVHAGARSRT